VNSWSERWKIGINEEKTQAIYFSRRIRTPDDELQLNERDIAFVNNATCLGVTFDRRTTWRQSIERTAVKALRTCGRTYALFRSGHLGQKSVMTYACPTSEYPADAHLLKLQRLQNRVFRAIRNLGRCTPIRELHVAFKIPYVYDYITKLCMAKAELTLNHVNPNVRGTEQGEAMHRKYKRSELGGGEAYDRSAE
jgi:hypothetical protein